MTSPVTAEQLEERLKASAKDAALRIIMKWGEANARGVVPAPTDDEFKVAAALHASIVEVEQLREAETMLREWRDAREAIFRTGNPSPEDFRRLGAAELALMTYARALPEEPAGG